MLMCTKCVVPQKGPFCLQGEYARAVVQEPPAFGSSCVLGTFWGSSLCSLASQGCGRTSAVTDQMHHAGMSMARYLVKTSG